MREQGWQQNFKADTTPIETALRTQSFPTLSINRLIGNELTQPNRTGLYDPTSSTRPTRSNSTDCLLFARANPPRQPTVRTDLPDLTTRPCRHGPGEPISTSQHTQSIIPKLPSRPTQSSPTGRFDRSVQKYNYKTNLTRPNRPKWPPSQIRAMLTNLGSSQPGPINLIVSNDHTLWV